MAKEKRRLNDVDNNGQATHCNANANNLHRMTKLYKKTTNTAWQYYIREKLTPHDKIMLENNLHHMTILHKKATYTAWQHYVRKQLTPNDNIT